jgi:hypothetical protein
MAAKQAPKTAKTTRVFGQRQEPAKMFRAGLYARVSTHDQQTLPLQMRTMRQNAAGQSQFRLKRSVPVRMSVNSGRNCSIRHVAVKSMSCWSGGWTAGAGRWSIWS